MSHDDTGWAHDWEPQGVLWNIKNGNYLQWIETGAEGQVLVIEKECESCSICQYCLKTFVYQESSLFLTIIKHPIMFWLEEHVY